MNIILEQTEVDVAFDRLAFLLANKPLDSDPLTYGDFGARFVPADDFMLMGKDNRFYQFKHRDTRNYVFMTLAGDRLEVPKTNQAFMHGTF